MEDLGGYIITGVVMFVVGLLLRELERKANVVWWRSHGATYNLTDLVSPVVLRSDAYTVQNTGERQTEFVEIAFKSKPDHFSLDPTLTFTVPPTSDGAYVVRIASLGPKEFFTLQILTYDTEPHLLYIRSDAGRARRLPVRWVRWYPRWAYGLFFACGVIGFGLVTHLGIRAVVFILQGLGAPG